MTPKMNYCRAFLSHAIYALILAAPALALDVTTNITENTTWAIGDSPVNITYGDFRVATNATLTIEPGVTVKISQQFNVDGQVRAIGEEGNRIVFDELTPGGKWGYLYFRKQGSDQYRTNLFDRVDFTNLSPYVYISEQTVSFSNCTFDIRSGGFNSYSICTYVNKSTGNPAHITMASNNVDIFMECDNPASQINAIHMEGFPCEFRDNVVSVTSTGRLTSLTGLNFFVFNTTNFTANVIGNRITVSNNANFDLKMYGITYHSKVKGPIIGNEIYLYSPTKIYGISKYDTNLVAENTIIGRSTWNSGFGTVCGIYMTCTETGEDDLIVNNRIDLATDGPARTVNGIFCQTRRVRGNRVKVSNLASDGQANGLYQEYYDGLIEGNTFEVWGTNGATVRAVYVGTHYVTTSVIRVQNNIMKGEGGARNYGLYIDAPLVISNSYNLFHGFASNYVTCSAGEGDVLADPLFADTNYHLLAGSPAIDAGTNQGWMASATDAEGNPRIENNVVDIGALEFIHYPISTDISSAAPNPTRDSPIPASVAFSEDVYEFEDTDITAGNATVADFTPVSASNYLFNLVPSGQGLVSAQIPQNVCTGASGPNASSVQIARLYDSVAPGVAMSSAAPDPTRDLPITVSVTFSEHVYGFTNTDITPANATVQNFAPVSASNYTFNLAPSGQGLVSADIAAGGATDAAGNSNTAAATFSRNYDSTAPGVAMTSAAPDPTRDLPITVTVTFSEHVYGFTNTDITADNATVENFAPVSASNYTFNLAPSGQGLVSADIAAGVATDAAGNSNTAAATFSRNYDSAAPGVAMSSAASDPTRNSPIPVSVTFSEHVYGFTNTDITPANGTVQDFMTVSASNYTFNLAPSGQGLVSADIDAGVATDAAGNSNTAAATFSRIYDTLAPTPDPMTWQTAPTALSATSIWMQADIAADANPPVYYRFTNVVSGAMGGWQTGEGWTNRGLGPNTEYGFKAQARDAAGNETAWSDTNTACTLAAIPRAPLLDIAFTDSVTIVLDAAVTGSAHNADGNPSDTEYALGIYTNSGATNYLNASGLITNAPVWDVFAGWGGAGGVAVSNLDPAVPTRFMARARNRLGTATAFGPSAEAMFDASIEFLSATPATNGAGYVELRMLARNPRRNDGQVRVQYGLYGPGQASATNLAWLSETVTADYGEPPVNNGTAYQVNPVCTTNLTNTLTLAWQSQAAGNQPLLINAATNVWIGLVINDPTAGTTGETAWSAATIDNKRPSVVLSSSASSPTRFSPIPMTATFSEDVSGFTLGSVTVGNGSASGLAAVNARTYTFSVTPGADGTVTVQAQAGAASDGYGNASQASAQFSIGYDSTAPGAAMSSAAPNPTTNSPIAVSVLFTESVSGFTSGDIALGNATLGGFTTVNAGLYTFTLTPLAEGVVSASFAAGAATDAAGNPCAAAALSRTYNAPLSPPSGVSASDGAYLDRVQVSWQAASGASGYSVLRGESTDPLGATVLSNTAASSTSASDPSAQPGRSYFYWVRARNGAAWSAAAGPDSGFRAVSAPASLQASDGEYAYKVGLSWSASEGAASYEIWRSRSPDPATAALLFTAAGTSGDDTSALRNRTYYYWLKAVSPMDTSAFSAADSGWRRGLPAGYADISRSDFAVFDSNTGLWYIMSVDGTLVAWAFQWGWPRAWPVPGDYNADGLSDLAVFDQNTGWWYVASLSSKFKVQGSKLEDESPNTANPTPNTSPFSLDTEHWILKTATPRVIAWAFQWGWPGAWPVSGDYDGDALSDCAVFDQNTGWWYVIKLDGTVLAWAFQWGWPGAWPVSGDYDGDGISDCAVFDQNTGWWYVASLSSKFKVQGSKLEDESPNTEHRSPITSSHTLNTEHCTLNTASPRVIAWAFQWGWPGAWPVSGDYDGDGISDCAVFDQNTGWWYVAALSSKFKVQGLKLEDESPITDHRSPITSSHTLNTEHCTLNTASPRVIAWAFQWGWPGAWPVSGDYDGDGISDCAVFDQNTGWWYVIKLDGTVLAWAFQWGWPGAIPVPGAAW